MGTVYGTNDKQTAEDYAVSEDNYVVDSETGEWLDTSLNRDAITEVPKNG